MGAGLHYNLMSCDLISRGILEKQDQRLTVSGVFKQDEDEHPVEDYGSNGSPL